MASNYRLRILDNTETVLRTVIRSFLFFMAAGLLLVDMGLSPSGLRYTAGGLILALAFGQHILERRWMIRWQWIAIAALILLAVGTFSPWLSVLFFLFGYGAVRFIKAPEIEVGEEGVRIVRTWGSQAFPWNEITRVLIRDGLLTIDLQNNTLYQLDLLDAESSIPNEAVFNQFCQTQLDRVTSISG